jgi:hypothetical protein
VEVGVAMGVLQATDVEIVEIIEKMQTQNSTISQRCTKKIY